jgi:hypothetical protein
MPLQLVNLRQDLFSSVTFIGYQINGLSGAAVSTLAIFLPLLPL